MTYWSTWHELVCPNCKKRNFVCAGDITDLTGIDPENYQCWNCHKCFDFDGKCVGDESCESCESCECCDEGVQLVLKQ